VDGPLVGTQEILRAASGPAAADNNRERDRTINAILQIPCTILQIMVREAVKTEPFRARSWSSRMNFTGIEQPMPPLMDRAALPHPWLNGPPDSSRQEMVSVISRWSQSDGEHRTAIPSLSFFRRSSPSESECSMVKPALVLAAQGQKRVILAGQTYDYGPMHGLITSMDLPVMARVITASTAKPYLCLVYELDLPHIADLMAEMGLAAPRAIPEGRAMSLCTVSAPLFDAALRLARLLETPADIPVLAPLIERELLYRLLTGEQGMRLRHLTMVESQSYKIARAIEYLKRHYTEPLRIGTLANQVNMSVSSLHHHFKAVTSMSPLQYQKQLRLQEARRLMIWQVSDVTSAAYSVGYESPSQFSRDYSRLFGAPPTRDIALLRETGREGR
jgi:AraC-like DNA-binding protein